MNKLTVITIVGVLMITIWAIVGFSTIGLPEECKILGELKQDATAELDAYEIGWIEQKDNLTDEGQVIFREKLLESREKYINVTNAYIDCLEK